MTNSLLFTMTQAHPSPSSHLSHPPLMFLLIEFYDRVQKISHILLVGFLFTSFGCPCLKPPSLPKSSPQPLPLLFLPIESHDRVQFCVAQVRSLTSSLLVSCLHLLAIPDNGSTLTFSNIPIIHVIYPFFILKGLFLTRFGQRDLSPSMTKQTK